MFSKELIEKIRAAFPQSAVDYSGNKRAFFDNGTGTLVLKKAARAEHDARINCSANIGGVFDESQLAMKMNSLLLPHPIIYQLKVGFLLIFRLHLLYIIL